MTIDLDELHRVIKRGDVTAVRAYIAAGGSVSNPDGQGWTPLTAAAYEGNTEMVRLFLDAGADANDIGAGINTPLELAAMADSLPAVDLLLKRGARTEHDGVPITERLRGWGYGDRTRILKAIERAHNTSRP